MVKRARSFPFFNVTATAFRLSEAVKYVVTGVKPKKDTKPKLNPIQQRKKDWLKNIKNSKPNQPLPRLRTKLKKNDLPHVYDVFCKRCQTTVPLLTYSLVSCRKRAKKMKKTTNSTNNTDNNKSSNNETSNDENPFEIPRLIN